MGERLDEVHVEVDRHNDVVGQPHVKITTDRIFTREKSYDPERFEDVQTELDKLSKKAYTWGAASLLAIGLAADQALRAIEDTPDRPLNAVITVLAVNAAYFWAKEAKKANNDREIERLEARTYQDAMRTIEGEFEAVYPVSMEERFKVAIGSLQAEGIDPTLDQIVDRDQSLRSSKKNKASRAGQIEAGDALYTLLSEGFIDSDNPMDPKSDQNNQSEETVFFVADIDKEM